MVGRLRSPGSLALVAAAAAFSGAALGCASETSPGAPDVGDAGAERPSWLGDAGLVTRAPVASPLRSLCGIASNPGDMPLGDDASSVALRAGYFDAAVDLGGVMIRRDFRWQEIEPARGTFEFAAYDALVDEAQQRGVPLLASLLYGTTWAHAGAKDEYYPPDDPADFADYAAAVAARYAGRIDAYEIWNEPNVGFRFWKTALSGEPAAYAKLLTEATPVVRAADPAAAVLLGGTAFTPQVIEGAIDWLSEAYAARPDLAESFDIAGIHTYMLYPPKAPPEIGQDLDPPLEAKIEMHAWLLDQHGSDAPLWITELGWPVTNDVDRAAQARYLVRATILAALAGASGIFWYTLRDFADHDPSTFPPEGSFGLMEYRADPSGSADVPKPVYTALRALLEIVGNRWPSGDQPGISGTPEGARTVRFAGGDAGTIVAAWSVTATDATIPAPADCDLLAQDGTSIGSAKKGDAVALSGDVTYLRY